MSRIQVSAALIVKNEECFLDACLTSLQGVADEVVIVDTGSTDGTRRVAERGGARVYDFPWTGDFSEARNHGLGLCRGEWILYIDADERVRPGSGANLLHELSSPNHIAYQALLHPRRGFTPFWILRLFRNDPAIRFRGVIHENLWPAVQDYRTSRGGEVANGSLVLDHDGYEGKQDRKNERNLPLLLRGIEQDPTRVYPWCHLANVYADIGKPELAEESWMTALGLVRKKTRVLPEHVLPYLALVQKGNEKGADMSALLDEALSRFPWNLNLVWQRGQALTRQGDFHAAIRIFEKLVEIGKAASYDHAIAYDLRLFDLYAYDALAVCYFRLARYDESRRYYELALEHDPSSMEYRVKLSLCTRLAGQQANVAARV